MKTKLLLFTVLLLFITLSSDLMALEIPKANNSELVLEENSSEKESKKQDLILQDTFQLISISKSSTSYSTLFLLFPLKSSVALGK